MVFPLLVRRCLAWMAMAWMASATLVSAAAADGPLRVCVSTPDLRSLVEEVGGPRVRVVSFSAGPEDPHEIELKPSLTRELDAADLFVQVGLGLENAWLERLLATVKNPAVKPGQPGNLNVGQGVQPLEGEEAKNVPGSFHEDGNPHYLLDPVEGLKAARAIRDRLAQLRPAWKTEFATRHDAFALRVGTLLAGEKCAREDDVVKLAAEFSALKTPAELEAFKTRHGLGGWMAELIPYRGRTIVGDHDLWPYFARRNGLTVLGYLEPTPGVPPTTRHLLELIGKIRMSNTRLLLSAPYFDQQHVRFVVERAGVRSLEMAHQTGGRPGTDSYVEMLQHNYRQVLTGLKETP